MTAENDGTGVTPEGDDPFAYLYRQQGGDGSQAPQPGTPRRSYNQVRTVGERQYGGQRTQQTSAYGQQPNAHYAAPETMPGGRAATQQHGSVGGDGHGGSRRAGGGSRNGLLFGAIGVVAAVVVGIGAAIYFNSDSGEDKADDPPASVGGGDQQQKKPDAKKLQRGDLVGKKQDAASLALAGGAKTASDIPNAQAANGTYVDGVTEPGASATWTVSDVPEAGAYTLFVGYGVPGEDAESTLTVNGEARQQPLNMSNFAHAKQGEWDKGWTRTFAWVDLKKGQNTFKISCEEGNKCDFNLDQVWLKAGKVQK